MEPVGVALGGLALVSLFSSCVECLDLIEQGRNYTRDVQVATTKLRLLRQRLQSWGEDLGDFWQDKEPEQIDKSLITDSLLGINGLLSDTSQLCDKYNLAVGSKPSSREASRGRESSQTTLSLASTTPHGWRQDGGQCAGNCHTCSIRDLTAGQEPRYTRNSFHLGDREHKLPVTAKYISRPSAWCSGSHASTPRPLHLFRLKFSWAVFDRKQFDVLIANLDFLVTNLEKVSPGFSVQHNPAKPYNHYAAASKLYLVPNTRRDVEKLDQRTPQDMPQQLLPPSPALSGKVIMDSEPEVSTNADPSTSSSPEGATSNASAFNYATRTGAITQSNHCDNKSSDQAKINSGQMGTGAPPCNTTMNKNTASGTSTQFSGTANDAMATRILSG